MVVGEQGSVMENRRLIEMTAAERKAEALEILSRENVNYPETRLNALTAFQVHNQYGGDTSYYKMDTCLKLPIPEDCTWELHSRVEYGSDRALAKIIQLSPDSYPDDTALSCEHGSTLPVAMLKAWWVLQPDT